MVTAAAGIAFLPIILFIVFVVVVLGLIAGLYNSLVQKRNRVDNAWAQVKVQLKRRWDLIPNLVETVKGYAAHESSTLEAVIAARNTAMGAAGDLKSSMEAENALSGTLRSLFAVAEAYPELKANTNFLQLQAELTDTENKIAYSRQFFNDTVLIYNNAIQMFPANLLAGLFGFTARDSFDISEEESQAVKVSF